MDCANIANMHKIGFGYYVRGSFGEFIIAQTSWTHSQCSFPECEAYAVLISPNLYLKEKINNGNSLITIKLNISISNPLNID